MLLTSASRLSLAVVAAMVATGRAVSAASMFSAKPHPVIVWHGLGDSAYAEGMQDFAKSLKEAFPGIYVHLVTLADSTSADQKAGFFGNVNDQVEQVCQQVAAVPELQGGADAIGFSQGGQLMRAYIERCNNPPIRNLVTFGSQHQGIADLPACKPGDFFCRLAEGALRGGINTEYAQSNVVPAQYFKNPLDPASYQGYLEHNRFLTDINNEFAQNDTYRRNLESLENFVMLLFDKDVTVEPKNSGWFATYPVANSTEAARKDPANGVVPLRQSDIYLEDRIGLRKLDKRGSLVMDVCHGVHMQINAACQMKVFGRYIGQPASLLPAPIAHAWSFSMWNLFGVRINPQPAVLQLAFALWLLTACICIARLSSRLVDFSRSKWEEKRNGRISLS